MTAKQATLSAVQDLPEACSIDDIFERVHFVAQVLEGLQDAEAGRLISTEELLDQLDRWDASPGR